jgi:hypothetical protein
MKGLISERWSKIRRLKIAAPASIVGQIICEGFLVMIYGPRGIGKSLLCQSLAYAVATGRDFLGFNVPTSHACVYADGEMSQFEGQSRFLRIEGDKRSKRAGRNLRVIRPNFDAGVLPDLETPEGQRAFEALLPDGASLVIVDNLSAWCRSGREDAESWRRLHEWALKMRARGTAIIFVHHANKVGRQRGTSMREDALDVVIALRHPAKKPKHSTVIELHFEKTRHLPQAQAEALRVRFHTPEGKPAYWSVKPLSLRSNIRRVLLLKKKGLSTSVIAKKLGRNRSTIHRWIKAARQRGKR